MRRTRGKRGPKVASHVCHHRVKCFGCAGESFDNAQLLPTHVVSSVVWQLILTRKGFIFVLYCNCFGEGGHVFLPAGRSFRFHLFCSFFVRE